LTASFARISLRPNSDHRRQLLLCRWGHGTEAIPGVYRCDDHKRSQTCCVGRTVIDFDRSLAKSSLRSGYRHWPVRLGRCCHSFRCALEQPRIPRAITAAPAAFSFETSTMSGFADAGPIDGSAAHTGAGISRKSHQESKSSSGITLGSLLGRRKLHASIRRNLGLARATGSNTLLCWGCHSQRIGAGYEPSTSRAEKLSDAAAEWV
jgi:hypothetical protein